MTKSIGMLLIISGILSLFGSAFIDINYGSHTQITGNVVENIITQPAIPMWGFDYLSGVMLSYSIVSMIMGVMFLFRV